MYYFLCCMGYKCIYAITWICHTGVMAPNMWANKLLINFVIFLLAN